MSLDTIKLYTIESGSHDLVKDFITDLKEEKASFRYFENRDLTVLKKHVETLLLKINNSLAGYGHLDKDGDIVWLGIVVLKKFQGKGIGAIIMNQLLKRAKDLNLSSINLSVDSENHKARSLYKKKGFRLVKETSEICYYTLHLCK